MNSDKLMIEMTCEEFRQREQQTTRLAEEIEDLRKQNAKNEDDAARYRWLRAQHWNEAPLCVVARPKDAVKLGHDCPSLDRLDTMIDDAMKTPNVELTGAARLYRAASSDCKERR